MLKRARSASRGFSPTVVMVGALAVLALGVTVGVLLAPSSVPTGIAGSARITSAPVSEVQTVDAQEVNLQVTASAAQNVTVGLAGMVTGDSCVVGGTAISGALALTVDNMGLVYLATSQPLWRDFSVGDRGDDVRSLQSELNRLGYPVGVDGVFRSSTLGAVIRLATQAGVGDARAWTTFPVSRFVWIPAPQVTTVSCEVHLGNQTVAGGSVATLPRGVSAASVTPLPANVMPGDRVIVLGSVSVPVDDTGAVTSPTDLNAIAASSAYQDYLAGSTGSGTSSAQDGGTSGGGSGLAVQYQLAHAVTVLSVPAAALYDSVGNSACVLAGSRPRAVTVVGSQLGASYVVPRDNTKITAVSLGTVKAPSCQ